MPHHHPRHRRLSPPPPETDPSESSSPSSYCRDRLHAVGSKPFFVSRKGQPTTTSSTCCRLNGCSSGCFRVKLRSPALSQMAGGGQGHAPARAHSVRTKKSSSVQQKKVELEDEVEDLLKKLDNEEKVHRVLERALQNSAGTTLEIPTFLPQKTKELLAELVMVEEEITRLESEVSKMQLGLTENQAHETAFKPDQYKYVSGNIIPPTYHISAAPVRAEESTVIQKKLTVETKPMFFINQAIKGGYTVHAFSDKAKSGNLLGDAIEKKESPFTPGLQGKAARKSGLVEKAITRPDLPPKQLPSNKLEHEQNISFNFSKEHSLGASSPEKSNQILQPNKLSERIMKCLICFFLRMMRTSRTMDLEKSSLIARSAHSSLNSRSFHFEGSLNPKPSITMQRETARQDPYGIFEIEGSILRDIGPYKNLVRFTSSSMDVKGLSSSMPLIRKLRILMSCLQEADPRFLTHEQKLAFWINMYNACIMNGFLELGLPSSPEKVLALRSKAVLNVGGNKLNALAIENFILRQPSNVKDAQWKGEKDDREDAVRIIYGLEKPEPNIVFALCCGNKSSPAVRIYTADGISSELEKAKLEYLQASIVVTTARKLMIPKPLQWNMRGFAGDFESLVEWIGNQLPTSGSLKKSMTECLRSQSRKKMSEILDVMPYEFEFQYLFFM